MDKRVQIIEVTLLALQGGLRQLADEIREDWEHEIVKNLVTTKYLKQLIS